MAAVTRFMDISRVDTEWIISGSKVVALLRQVWVNKGTMRDFLCILLVLIDKFARNRLKKDWRRFRINGPKKPNLQERPYFHRYYHHMLFIHSRIPSKHILEKKLFLQLVCSTILSHRNILRKTDHSWENPKTTKKETYRNASRLIKIKVVSTSLHTKAMTSYIFLSHPLRQTIESLLLLFILLFYLSSVLAFHIDMR